MKRMKFQKMIIKSRIIKMALETNSIFYKLLAVLVDGKVISKIDNNEFLQIISILKSPCNIMYMNNPTKRVEKLAVMINPMMISHIKDPSLELQIITVNKNSLNIGFIKNPSSGIQYIAVSNNPQAMKYIKNPCKEVLDMFK